MDGAQVLENVWRLFLACPIFEKACPFLDMAPPMLSLELFEEKN
jgi:hypothetical protein